jgi:hypothetical protein
MPNDGEWECADLAGVVVCHGGERAAGVAPGASDPGFVCGARSHGSKERVCVDTSPDFPTGTPRAERCAFEPHDGVVRICERNTSAHGITDACSPAKPCVSGLSCVAARCVPRKPAPSCLLDKDCDHGACRFGSCMDGAP